MLLPRNNVPRARISKPRVHEKWISMPHSRNNAMKRAHSKASNPDIPTSPEMKKFRQSLNPRNCNRYSRETFHDCRPSPRNMHHDTTISRHTALAQNITAERARGKCNRWYVRGDDMGGVDMSLKRIARLGGRVWPEFDGAPRSSVVVLFASSPLLARGSRDRGWRAIRRRDRSGRKRRFGAAASPSRQPPRSAVNVTGIPRLLALL